MPSSPRSPSEARAGVEAGPAVFSPDRVYRYVLRRRWCGEGPTVNFILLNPSTADESRLDPTLRRCAGFARSWGFAGMVITNVFAFRSTCPDVLCRAAEPVGPANDRHLLREARRADAVVAGWGNHAAHLGRAAAVARLLDGVEIRCLGVNGTGMPRHPLYVAATAPLVPFSCTLTPHW